ncbi:class I SAM-dependent methyltransferase, partial [Alphaproteobacteria bacterium]|nr:class I SAM-dependent methyltransferase [Alphaproteobacteria bacterium]
MINKKNKSKFNIKDMSLYKTTDRFINNYNNLKKVLKRNPTLEELSEIDQLHYNGIMAVEDAIKSTKITNSSVVLDIGSGIGGPARYIANKTQARVYAIEIQNKLNMIAKKLSFTYKLNTNIKHISGDILEYNFKDLKFNNIVSWLAFYHIPKRK